MKSRNFYLDLLRASAIILVLIHHIAQFWPGLDPAWLQYTRLGARGVDLFFVLSGWLIGGLFWREVGETGKIDLLRFWTRRWLRTIPPYLAALALAWFAVMMYRDEPFDWGYLIFIQNYYAVMPFFLVSWSLCIEEHFYLFAPPLYWLLRERIGWMGPILVLIPGCLRAIEYTGGTAAFGYEMTASHLYADGLLLGFYSAYLYSRELVQVRWLRLPLLIAAALCVAVLSLDLSHYARYVLYPLLYAVLFAVILVLVVDARRLDWLGLGIIVWIARISYSVYLTHALVIHAFTRVIQEYSAAWGVLGLILQVGFIFLTGSVFFQLFERSAFRLRHKLAPA